MLRFVQRNGLSCSECHWTKRCAGCTIYPGDAEKQQLWTAPFVAVDWHPSLLEEHYNPTANEVIEHTSVAQLLEEQAIVNSQVTSLEDCLFKYHKKEDLEDSMHCTRCQSQ